MADSGLVLHARIEQTAVKAMCYWSGLLYDIPSKFAYHLSNVLFQPVFRHSDMLINRVVGSQSFAEQERCAVRSEHGHYAGGTQYLYFRLWCESVRHSYGSPDDVFVVNKVWLDVMRGEV